MGIRCRARNDSSRSYRGGQPPRTLPTRGIFPPRSPCSNPTLSSSCAACAFHSALNSQHALPLVWRIRHFAKQNDEISPPFATANGGGEGGIRTHGPVAGTHAFQACRFVHSRTSPCPGILGRRHLSTGPGERQGGASRLCSRGFLRRRANGPVRDSGPGRLETPLCTRLPDGDRPTDGRFRTKQKRRLAEWQGERTPKLPAGPDTLYGRYAQAKPGGILQAPLAGGTGPGYHRLVRVDTWTSPTVQKLDNIACFSCLRHRTDSPADIPTVREWRNWQTRET